MPEWLGDLISAIGGGIVVLVGILTIFKSLIIKFFETGIESSFEKKFEKFKNKLERSTKAYEIILDREMRFYKELEPIIAELIPIEHDLLYYLRYNEESNREKQSDAFKTNFKRYCQLVIELKKSTLIHHSYIPQDIFNAFTSVVKQMQDSMPLWRDMTKLLSVGEYSKIDYIKCEIVIDDFLKRLSFAETMVVKRLKELSGD